VTVGLGDWCRIDDAEKLTVREARRMP